MYEEIRQIQRYNFIGMTLLTMCAFYMLDDIFDAKISITKYTDHDRFRIFYRSKNNPKCVKIVHEGINCMHQRGHELKYFEGDVNNSNFERIIDIPIKPKFIKDCEECNVKTILMYKSLFGFHKRKELKWNPNHNKIEK